MMKMKTPICFRIKKVKQPYIIRAEIEKKQKKQVSSQKSTFELFRLRIRVASIAALTIRNYAEH